MVSLKKYQSTVPQDMLLKGTAPSWPGLVTGWSQQGQDVWLCFQPGCQHSRWGSVAAGQPHLTDCLTSDTAAQSHQLLGFETAYQAFKLPH